MAVQKQVQSVFYQMPLFQDAVSAGFPNQATEEAEDNLDLNSLLIRHPAATFLMKASGSSMIKAGIHPHDFLIVDRSIKPSSGKIVLAQVNGELMVRRLLITGKRVQLISENRSYRPIEIGDGVELQILGVVTRVIHPL